jgi:HlyD family secretion protein
MTKGIAIGPVARIIIRMIKNHGALVFSAFLLLSSCSRRATVPPGFQGVVEYDERVVAFEVPGRIAKVHVHRGDLVKDGDTLAELDDSLEVLVRDARASEADAARADLALIEAGARSEDIGSAAAELRSAIAVESLASKNHERAKGLFATKSIAQAELDRSQADLDHATASRNALENRLAELRHGARPQEIARAKARVASADAAARLEEERLSRYTLRSHHQGAVLDVHVEEGELGAVGTPVVTLADVTHPYTDVFVPQGNMDGIKLGSKTTVRVDASSAPLSGTVEYVAQKTEFTPRFLFSEQERPNLVIRVRVRIDDPEQRLHAGVPAFATIERPSPPANAQASR